MLSHRFLDCSSNNNGYGVLPITPTVSAVIHDGPALGGGAAGAVSMPSSHECQIEFAESAPP